MLTLMTTGLYVNIILLLIPAWLLAVRGKGEILSRRKISNRRERVTNDG